MDISSKRLITRSVREAAGALLAGQLVAIPTETVYGLAADATNPKAVASVFALKGRPADHPLIVHCSSAAQAWQCVQGITPAARRLADAFWPGPLTLVLPRSAAISPAITGGQASVAIRVPDHPLTRQLLVAIERPLVAPSANLFGRVSPTSAEHVRDEFPKTPLLILDGGPCDVGIESTIVDCRSDASVRILRPGKITAQHLVEELGDGCLGAAEAAPVRVSGALPAHYAPQAQVILLAASELSSWCELHAREALPTLLITTALPPREIPDGINWYSVSTDTSQFAREMYALFRRADRESCQRIVVELPSVEGIGLALRDRLQRAAN